MAIFRSVDRRPPAVVNPTCVYGKHAYPIGRYVPEMIGTKNRALQLRQKTHDP